jgi:hypothetical protein
MSDRKGQDVGTETVPNNGDNDLETEGHVKPNMDPVGEIDQGGVPPEDREN